MIRAATTGTLLLCLLPASQALANDVEVGVTTATGTNGVTTFTGDVENGPRAGMVRLQRKVPSGWRTVTSSDYTPKGYTVKYASDPGVYRVAVRLPRQQGQPRLAASTRVDLATSSPNPTSRKWVIGVGDSYMSGEGASYAGYGPWCGSQHTDWFGDCSALNQDDKWWVSAFGSSLKQTYPGDYGLPISQPGLTKDSGYTADPIGVKCHRSSSALTYWNDPGYAAINFACSGAVRR